MQPFVHSVFLVVTSVIATLLVAGLTGIIAVLLMDRESAPPTGTRLDMDGSAQRAVQSPRVSSAQRELAAH